MPRIDELDPTALPSLLHEFPAMKDGITVKLTGQQMANLITAIIVDSAPGTLDTLNKLAAALGDDPNFAATVMAALALKAPLLSPTLTTPILNDPTINGATGWIVGRKINGLKCTNGPGDTTNDITVSPGSTGSMDTVPVLMVLASAITKQIDATWVAGNNAGGRFPGVSLADGNYHFFLIRNPTTGVVDAGFDTSVTAANAPAGFTQYHRICSPKRIAGVIKHWRQEGNRFNWNVPVLDRNSNSTATDFLLPLTVPAGINCFPLFTIRASCSAGNVVHNCGDGAAATAAVRVLDAPTFTISATPPPIFLTDTSQQIRYAVASGGTISNGETTTYGYIDTRDQDL